VSALLVIPKSELVDMLLPAQEQFVDAVLLV